MISIIKATEKDYHSITSIGYVSVEEAHRESCAPEILKEYLDQHYNDIAIKKELTDTNNIYHIIYVDEKAIGFSKIVLNAAHPTIPLPNVTKLDRIYLLKEYQHLKLGYQLLQFNIELAKKNDQAGLWLFTWIGNTKAVNFYLKNGFTIIGNHHFKVTDNHYNENHHMYLQLSA